MKSLAIADGYLIVLAKGEPIIRTLEDHFKSKEIKSGFINGLGAVSTVELGFYDLEAKQYQWTQFEQPYEITSLSGVVSESSLHIHVTLAGSDNQAIGGHLKEAIVGGTCEIYLKSFERSIRRATDDQTGLNLLDI